MKLKTVKCAADVKLNGAKAELVIRDDSIRAIIISDEAGNFVRAEMTGWNDFVVSIPAGKEFKDVWRLSGTIKGISFCEDFKHQHEAISRQTEIERDISECVQSNIEQVKVEMPDTSV